jgi:arsenite-transporting ATPase
MPEEVLELLPRLRDPDFTKVLIVTLAEATPVSEARRLEADLGRAGIRPWAWIVNQVFAGTGTIDPMLRAKGLREIRHVEDVVEASAVRVSVVPWLAEPPVGAGLLGVLDEGNGVGDDATDRE